MRKSLEDIKHLVRENQFTGLPEELHEYYCYLVEGGHCIMAVPESLLSEAETNGELELFECPIPVNYVLEMGYRKYNGIIVVDALYKLPFGLMIDEEYEEY